MPASDSGTELHLPLSYVTTLCYDIKRAPCGMSRGSAMTDNHLEYSDSKSVIG